MFGVYRKGFDHGIVTGETRDELVSKSRSQGAVLLCVAKDEAQARLVAERQSEALKGTVMADVE